MHALRAQIASSVLACLERGENASGGRHGGAIACATAAVRAVLLLVACVVIVLVALLLLLTHVQVRRVVHLPLIAAVIQPAPGGTPDKPALQRIGGAGRIVSHQETSDGRYLMVLEGLTRFAVDAELDRQAKAALG